MSFRETKAKDPPLLDHAEKKLKEQMKNLKLTVRVDGGGKRTVEAQKRMRKKISSSTLSGSQSEVSELSDQAEAASKQFHHRAGKDGLVESGEPSLRDERFPGGGREELSLEKKSTPSIGVEPSPQPASPEVEQLESEAEQELERDPTQVVKFQSEGNVVEGTHDRGTTIPMQPQSSHQVRLQLGDHKVRDVAAQTISPGDQKLPENHGGASSSVNAQAQSSLAGGAFLQSSTTKPQRARDRLIKRLAAQSQDLSSPENPSPREKGPTSPTTTIVSSPVQCCSNEVVQPDSHAIRAGASKNEQALERLRCDHAKPVSTLKKASFKRAPVAVKFVKHASFSPVTVTHVDSLSSFFVVERTTNIALLKDVDLFLRDSWQELLPLDEQASACSIRHPVAFKRQVRRSDATEFFRGQIINPGKEVQLIDVGEVISRERLEKEDLRELPEALGLSNVPCLCSNVSLHGLKYPCEEDEDVVGGFKTLLGLNEEDATGVQLQAMMVAAFQRDGFPQPILLKDGGDFFIHTLMANYGDGLKEETVALREDLKPADLLRIVDEGSGLHLWEVAGDVHKVRLLDEFKLSQVKDVLLGQDLKSSLSPIKTARENQLVVVGSETALTRFAVKEVSNDVLTLEPLDDGQSLKLRFDDCSSDDVFCWKLTGQVMEPRSASFAVFHLPEVMLSFEPSSFWVSLDGVPQKTADECGLAKEDLENFFRRQQAGPFRIVEIMEDDVPVGAVLMSRTDVEVNEAYVKFLRDSLAKANLTNFPPLNSHLRSMPLGEREGVVTSVGDPSWLVLDEDRENVAKANRRICDMIGGEMKTLLGGKGKERILGLTYAPRKNEIVILCDRSSGKTFAHRAIMQGRNSWLKLDSGEAGTLSSFCSIGEYKDKVGEQIVLPFPGTKEWRSFFGVPAVLGDWTELTIYSLPPCAFPFAVDEGSTKLLKGTTTSCPQIRFYVKGNSIRNSIDASLLALTR